MALGSVVTGAGLAEDEVIRAEDLAEGAGADGVHGPGLEVHEDGAGHVAAAGGLVEVDVDALQLEVGVAVVGARRVDAVLIGDDLPELGADLVACASQRGGKPRKKSVPAKITSERAAFPAPEGSGGGN